MEDESGLELGLGLFCGGGSSSKPKSKNGSSLDTRADEFKNFLNAGSQRSNPSKSEENIFNEISKVKEDSASVNSNGKGLWYADNNNKHGQIEEDKRVGTGNKRKVFFDEINHQKKQGIEVHHADFHDRARTPQISMNEDHSNAENGGMGPFSLNGDGSKLFMRLAGSSNASKKVSKASDRSVTDFNGKMRFIGSSEKDFKRENLTYGGSFPIQQVNLRNAPYPSSVKESNSVGAPSPQIPRMIPHPILDKDNSQGLGFHPQQLHASFVGMGAPNSAAKHVISNNLSEVMPFEGRPLGQTKGDRKQHGTLQNPSSQVEEVKGSNTNLREKNISEQSTGEGCSIDFSAIKLGLAADVKFGGSGSLPNLPWVSTTGSNGKTISGVTYKYNINQIKIVCACHGSHMSPDDFIQHANEDIANPNIGGSVLGTPANGNPSASTHS